MAGSVKLVLFDLANVVVRCDHMATYRAWGEAVGEEAEAIAGRHPTNPTNVEGALAIGIESVLVESPGDVVGTLGARGLLAE